VVTSQNNGIMPFHKYNFAYNSAMDKSPYETMYLQCPKYVLDLVPG
jgi:hypothetical protein